MTTDSAPPVRIAPLLAAIALLAFQLRSPLVALAPVARQTQEAWGVTPAVFGLLTTLPLLCFALATPLAPLAARLFGIEGSIVVCIGGIVVATVLRSLDGFGVALAASVLLGLAVTIGNVLVPSVIRRDVPPRGRAAATGIYTLSINVGTMLTAIVTVPLAALLGWRVAVAAWSVVGVLTAVVWLLLLRGHRASGRVAVAEPTVRFRPDAVAWLLGITFAAQSFSYYGFTTWLPTLLADEHGLSATAAGTASSVFQLAGIAGAIAVPLLRLRLRPRGVLTIIGLLWIVLPAGLLVAPDAYLALSAVSGIAQGAGFAAVMTIITEIAPTASSATALSAFVQSVGYVFAATAPPVIGAAHSATGGWTAPVGILVGTTALFLIAGVTAASIADRRAA